MYARAYGAWANAAGRTPQRWSLISCDERAFAAFGGVTWRVVCDSMTVVHERDAYGQVETESGLFIGWDCSTVSHDCHKYAAAGAAKSDATYGPK